MWLALLRRSFFGKSRSPQSRQTRQQGRRIIPKLDYLEDRTLLSGVIPYATPTNASQLAQDITYADNNPGSYTITLASSSSPYILDNTTGPLPEITANVNLTIIGNGATVERSSSASTFRLFDVAAGASVTLGNMTLTGGKVSGATAQGGAIFNSGKLTLNTVIVGGNSAVGGSGQNAAGGGIYSNGGSLTLFKDLIGRKAIQSRTISYNSAGTPTKSGVTTKVVGGTNRATGGTGGSGQGAGLYVAGGIVNVSQCTIASNKASGGTYGQGGGLYANGSALTLKNDLFGQKVTRFKNNGKTTKTVYTGGANIAGGGAGQGGGLYISGGMVNVTNTVTNCTIQDNRVNGAAGAAGSVGGNGQGGGIYANATTLTFTGGSVSGNDASAGSGGAGTVNHFAGFAGGNSQGGGIYANATTLIVNGAAVNGNTLNLGNGGAGAAGTANHVTGGAGGASGLGQGGGIFAQGGSLTLTNSAAVNANTINSTRGGNGGAGYNVAAMAGAGGAGGAGGITGGGGVFSSNATVVVLGGATINADSVNGGYGGTGGNGGPGKAGGQGGAAGQALGGGLYVSGGSVNISGGAAIDVNTVNAGWGGYGGNGGVGGLGGVGGAAEGGGLYVSNAPVTLLSGTGGIGTGTSPGINANTANAGRGGNGGTGATGAGAKGGAGGQALGGGVFITASNLAVTFGSNIQSATTNGNTATAGVGGSGGKGVKSNGVGGNGGLATGGGVTIVGNTATVSSNKLTFNNTTITGNTVNGGAGGVGVASARGGVISNYGNGGDVQGGGLFVANLGSATVLNSTIEGNLAAAGGGAAGGSAAGAAKYGLGGTALGGGLYANNSTLSVLNSTFANNLLAAATQVGTSHSVGGHSTGGGTAQGGGLYSTNGTLSLTNDTVAWNYLVSYTNRGAVMGQGAGVYNGPANTLNMENAIVVLDLIFTNSIQGENNNSATSNDDLAGTAAAKKDDNLIAGVNTNDANLVPAIGASPAGSQQLFAVPATTNTLGGTAALSGQVPGNYGGLTYTLPLAWNTSPAISTGDPSAAGLIASAEGVSTATDQRGLPRAIDGTIDIGATETQVTLTGGAPSTVTAGGSITYTLTVTNNESTAAKVSLTDVMDANTTYQSSSGTNWTITPPTSSNPGGTLTATASLAANSTATLTITVTVSSSVASGTTIANTASIVPTGNNSAGKRSWMMDTTIPDSIQPPIANPDYYTVLENGVLTVPASSGVLANDKSTVPGGLSAVLIQGPSHGTLIFNADGSFTYTPAANFVGTDTFTYEAKGSNGGLSSPTLVTIQVDYKFGGFLPPLSNGITFALNRTIPIKFTLSDANGNAITSLSAVTSLQVAPVVNGVVGTPFTPTSSDGLGLQYSGDYYQFNWKTKGLTAGTYEIILKLADGTTQTKTIQLTANGSGSNAQATTGSDVESGAAAGHLLGGNLALYVDNSNGKLTSDELARIQDAVNAVDAIIAPYNVAINEVTDPTLADVTLSMGTSSAVGNYAQGVLGCYTTTGQITLIQGWNWYAGSNPTLIGANQYDFQTTVTHELGHALGLGESSISTSAMSGTLTPGTTIRTLTTADLNIPYVEESADAQRADVPQIGGIAGAAAGNSASSAQGMPSPSNTNLPSSTPLSAVDQMIADLALLLSAVRNAYQTELSSAAALWQQADTLVVQRLDALWSLETGAMGMSMETRMFGLLFADTSSSNGV
jgi:uncharacterized repeat protein (TIGR01451 family)